MRVDIENTIALVIDYQEKLVPVMHEKTELMKNTTILLSGLKELEVPMCVTQQYTKGLGETVDEVWQSMGCDSIHTREHVEKIRFSAYQDIKDKISEKKYVIVCGIEAHICVLQTVIDLAAAGFTPVLVVDCISSRNERNVEYAIQRGKMEGAILTTYESILFELLEVAGTQKSKKIQKIIK